jgi:hypothetical protein
MIKKCLFLIIIFTLTVPVTLRAQEVEVREISISPFLEEHEVEKGGTKQSKIELSNNSDKAITVFLSTRDFLPGDRGQPIYIPDDEYNELTFSLAAWIVIKEGSKVSLAPGEKRTINYSINPPENAEQGSHYGAILFSLTDGSTLSGVGITQSVASIIIVRYGEARSEGQLSFSANPTTVWWNSKIEFTNTFDNTGLVHVKPKGEVVIRNIFGRIVATPVVNRDAVNVLPKSDRTFISDWFPSKIAFGPYFAESNITYGRERLEAKQKVVIWILPVYILAILALILIVLIWFGLHGRHWHRKRVINRHFGQK